MKKLPALIIISLLVILLLPAGERAGPGVEPRTSTTDWAQVWCRGFGVVLDLAYSPDGSKLAIAGTSGVVNIIETSTYELELQLIGHLDSVRCIAWSQDGSKIIASSDDGLVKVWSAITGEELKTLPEHYESITALELAPNQQFIATGTGRRERIVRIFDYETYEYVRNFTGFNDAIMALAFSPDSKRIACAVGEPRYEAYDSIIKIFELATGKLLHTLEGHEGGIEALDWSSDGNWLVSGSYDNTIKIWDAATGACETTLTGHEARVNKVLWSKDCSKILSCSDDMSIKLWDVAEEEVLKNFVDDSKVKALDFSLDEERFVSGSELGKVKIWRVEKTSEPEREFYEHTNRIRAVDWSPDGTKIVSGALDKTLRIWDLETGERKIVNAGSEVYAVDWSPDGNRIISGHGDSMIRVWSATGAFIMEQEASKGGWVNGVACSPDCKYIASASEDGRPIYGTPVGVRVFWYANLTLKCELKGHIECVNEVVWSPNGTLLASASDDRTIRIWDVEKEEQIYKTFYPDSFFRSCDWSPDGSKIAGGTYSSIRVFDSQLNFIASLGPINRYAESVSWWQDNDKLVSGADRDLKIWSVSKSDRVSMLSTPLTAGSYIHGVRWHESNRIVTGDRGRIVRIWQPVLGIEVDLEQKVRSGAEVPLSIRISHYDKAIANADVSIQADYGTFSKNEGKTNWAGELSTTFYAPQTETNISCTIRIQASKPGSEYVAGKLVFPIQVYPKVLLVDLTAPSEVTSGKSLTLTLSVSDYVASVPSANIAISSDCGSIAPAYAETDETGNLEVTFEAPKVYSKKTCTISIMVSKEGYPSVAQSFLINIIPEKEAAPELSLILIALVFTVIPILGVLAAILYVKKKF